MQTTITAADHQERWNEITRDPTLRDLPYKVETNNRGQLLLRPHTNRHSKRQKAIADLLRQHAPDGESYPEYALATPRGVKAPDVVWMSPGREQRMDQTGDPSTLAPEICVEVMSSANTEEEMHEKRGLYRSIGAKEVWIVSEDGRIRFFGKEELNGSQLAPGCPSQIA